MQSQLVFHFRQLRTPDGRVGGGGGRGRGSEGTSRAVDGGEPCDVGTMPGRSAEVGRVERVKKASSHHMCALTHAVLPTYR